MSDLVGNPEDWFSHNEAQFKVTTAGCLKFCIIANLSGEKAFMFFVFLVKGFIQRRKQIKYLSPPSFHHELPGEMCGRLSLQGSNLNTLVEGVPGDYLPVVKH